MAGTAPIWDTRVYTFAPWTICQFFHFSMMHITPNFPSTFFPGETCFPASPCLNFHWGWELERTLKEVCWIYIIFNISPLSWVSVQEYMYTKSLSFTLYSVSVIFHITENPHTVSTRGGHFSIVGYMWHM